MATPTHYVYDPPDLSVLRQGDILKRTPELLEHLGKYHPYYKDHKSYCHFMVVTQSCDLALRGNQSLPASPYVNIAAVRPLEEVLKREAAKLQPEKWQRETKVISDKARTSLQMFLASLIDNNKEGYFYLHQDLNLGIQMHCCAILRLSVALKSEHYQMCLNAKIAQLKEPFQAKLGYLIGHMYSRIGTTEWNTNMHDRTADKFASDVLKSTFLIFKDAQIKEGIAELKRQNTYSDLEPEAIKEFINQKKVVSRRDKLRGRAYELLASNSRLFKNIENLIVERLQQDEALWQDIFSHLTSKGMDEADGEEVKNELTKSFMSQIRDAFRKMDSSQKKNVHEQLLRDLLNDTQIIEILRD